MANRILLVIGTLVLATVGAACGGDDGDDGISKEAFIEQATEICEDTRDRLTAEADELDPDDPNAVSDYVRTVAAEILDEIGQLRDLGFPDGDEKTLNQAFRVYEERFEQLRTNPSAAAVVAEDAQLIAAGEALEEYGLPACGADLGG